MSANGFCGGSWRRWARQHAFGVYRYADNLLRMPPRTVAWRIYNRILAPRYYKLQRRLCPRRQPSPSQWRRMLGGEPLEAARKWLAAPAGRFYTDWCDTRELAKLAMKHDPDGASQTVRLADEFMAGRFRLLEAKPPVEIRLPFNWQLNPLNDIEWPHAMNRFRRYARCLSRAYLYTGQEKYAAFLLDIIDDWIASNPVGTAIAWASMATSLRLIEWCWLLHLLRGCQAMTAERLARIWGSMLLQAQYLLKHPEIELSDNHLIYNLGCLNLLASAFPFMLTGRQAKWARREYLRQLRRQHRPDGMNAEQSTHYFMQVARIYIETHWLETRLGRADSDTARLVGKFIDDIAGMIRPDGTIPLLSDAFTSFFETSGTEDAHVLLGWACAAMGRGDVKRITGRLREGAVWLLADKAEQFEKVAPSDPPTQLCLSDSGYYIQRDGWGRDASYCCVDAGPLGFPPVPAHGHPDLLSFEWFWRGRPVVADPGTYEYEPGEWAYYFRRTRAHATVTVDQQDQATQWGFVRWVDLPAWRVIETKTAPGMLWLEGEHDSYARLSEPVIHRRRIAFVLPNLVVIEDILTGRGEHLLEQAFPLHPDWRCEISPDQSAALTRADGGAVRAAVLLAPAGVQISAPRGQREPMVWGFHASNYGVCEPSVVLVFSARAAMPARFLTVLAGGGSVQAAGEFQWKAVCGGASFDIRAGRQEGFAIEQAGGEGPRVLLASHAELAGGRIGGTSGGWVHARMVNGRWEKA